ncbi:MAG: transglycosylase family protein, partial [Mycobacterium sp.]
VTGAVIGGGTIGLAAQAQAATDSEWDTVAACESSGNWAINTGNGYQGGLQFSPSTWLGYGGGQFASAAHLASRDQQIAIAEKVLAGQGRGAWPVCGRGLSGPTPRDVSTAETEEVQPTTPLDTPADAPVPAQALDAPAPAPAPQEPAQQPAQPEIIAISETTTTPDEVVAVGAPLASGDINITQAGFSVPAPQAPADPAVPPVVPTTVVPAPADAAAPAPAGDTTAVAAAQLPDGVPHLPSPDNPPPGTSDEPTGDPSNPNVSYIKDLWHALQNKEIDRNDLLVALAQRSFTAPIPGDAAAPPQATAPASDAVPAAADSPAAPAPAPAPATATDPVL